jgi:predicted RecB family nuclease
MPNDARHSTRNSSTVRIIDYKTGAPDRDSLQLPLYAAMWEQIHDQGVERLGTYSLKDGNVTWYPKPQKMDEFINEKLRVSAEIVEEMKRGHYPPEPQSAQECRYCYHSPLCEGKK